MPLAEPRGGTPGLSPGCEVAKGVPSAGWGSQGPTVYAPYLEWEPGIRELRRQRGTRTIFTQEAQVRPNACLTRPKGAF